MDINRFKLNADDNLNLNEISTSFTANYKDKQEAKKELKENIKKLSSLQDMFYAYDKYSLLLIFQAMDAAGKDSTIKHVMSGLNPQGTQVISFKEPSSNEIDHDYLWRIHRAAPERGRIGIFNRSHYEEVLVVKVHDLIKNQKLPDELITKNIWQKRYKQINDFERILFENGTIILKFFLHVSKEEQRKRFIKRIDKESKNWKFSAGDIKERDFWDDYQKAYQEALAATNTKHAPWFIIPADHKWFMRLTVSEILVNKMESLKMNYPKLNDEQLKNLEECKIKLLNEE